jgi:predicted metal-dependent phosphoesterase TrpH
MEGPPDSQSFREAGYSLESDGTGEGTRHFLLVFFDILHIEGQSLLDEPYRARRQTLEEIVRVIEGFVRFFLLPWLVYLTERYHVRPVSPRGHILICMVETRFKP